jgi:hypothetical protein
VRRWFSRGRIHASADGTKVISYSMMRSEADRKLIQEHEDTRELLEALEAVAVPQRNTYELVCVYTARPHTGATDVPRGAY